MVFKTDQTFMQLAVELARDAGEHGEVPVGAVVVDEDMETILSVGSNAPVATHDPTAHAEIIALRQAAQRKKNYRLTGTTLYVSLEPCAMCAGAIAQARVSRVVFAAEDKKGGAVVNGPRFFEQPTCHHRPEISQGLMAQTASDLLVSFFRARR
ncbi:tRNA adenosine(34) deaminase TadA [Parvularcula sp. IMCC14364]|uniref:tRNA adenosine(34) deaminase TadA n=1 Tax=Parvularcula sp. IMCC14364 TaxID=3067902 RepID=UPI0027420F41|nr:tRNA adenosine(34) deaminase TadA [Parvularcula sp. IMCC14364]